MSTADTRRAWWTRQMSATETTVHAKQVPFLGHTDLDR